MARDYKRKRRSRSRKRESSPWKILASGFGLGLIAAFGLYVFLQPGKEIPPDRPVPNPSVAPQSSVEAEPTDSAETKADIATEQPAATSPEPAPSAPVQPVDAEFDFYRELPNFVVVVADEDNQPVSKPAPKPATASTSSATPVPTGPASYILQAGSFRKFIDADRRKAELAFKGIESTIQQVDLKEKGVWYRVYVGPGDDFARFERLRSDLRQANIDAAIYRFKK